MDILIFQNQSDLKISTNSVEKVVQQFLSFEKIHFDEVSIHFVDNSTMCDLHLEYFDDPSPTDCISFPMDDMDEIGYRVMGDVFVCPQTAIDYVKANGGNVYQEVTLYVIHGLLHLLGYDDIDEEDRKEMRKLEAAHTENLRTNDITING